MIFNDVTNKLGICQEIDSLCDTDTTSYPVADKTRRVNSALETLVVKVINADGTWQYDDTNQTDLPVGTGTLVAGQTSYSFASEYLDILNVKVLDAGGLWHILTPFDQSDSDEPFENITSQSGLPMYYDKLGDSIRIAPAPTAATTTLASGLKVAFKRTATLFTASDTTKEPGLPSPFHVTLAKMAALPYCKTYKKDRVPQLEKDIQEDTDELIKFYSRREKDVRKVMTMKRINFR